MCAFIFSSEFERRIKPPAIVLWFVAIIFELTVELLHICLSQIVKIYDCRLTFDINIQQCMMGY